MKQNPLLSCTYSCFIPIVAIKCMIKEDKVILKRITGAVNLGEVLAEMSHLGSGKIYLLNSNWEQANSSNN
ncbi:unnamed protein product [Lupinus luteus]|uniref:Uncharacterized protein n=1 Tax=Lupinus luteus TaxID=3873 RepID=A0AAV1XWS4_LUPLU